MNTHSTTTLDDIWALFRETDRKFQETDRKFQDNAERFRETDRKFQDTDRQLRELGKQIGGLGNKFGSFTEGLALPSMQKILQQRFGVEIVSPSVRVAKSGQHLEIDVLAYANGDINAACGGSEKPSAGGTHRTAISDSAPLLFLVSRTSRQGVVWHSRRRGYSIGDCSCGAGART